MIRYKSPYWALVNPKTLRPLVKTNGQALIYATRAAAKQDLPYYGDAKLARLTIAAELV